MNIVILNIATFGLPYRAEYYQYLLRIRRIIVKNCIVFNRFIITVHRNIRVRNVKSRFICRKYEKINIKKI